jgi:hypothetical protein
VSVGFPADLYLHDFGLKVNQAFGETAYIVGSAMTEKDARDVDVVVMLELEVWEREFGVQPSQGYDSPKWRVLCQAFSELGKRMTGLNIDFKIQEREWANDKHKSKGRNALICSFNLLK